MIRLFKEIFGTIKDHPRCRRCQSWHKGEMMAEHYGYCFELRIYVKDDFYCPKHSDFKEFS